MTRPLALVTALFTTVLVVPVYAQSPSAKLDESLREIVERGCTGTQSVIITTKPGYRQTLRDSLAAHGDYVKGEFPSLEAVSADVHCEDLAALAEFTMTGSISANSRVAVQQLAPISSIASTATQEAVAIAK